MIQVMARSPKIRITDCLVILFPPVAHARIVALIETPLCYLGGTCSGLFSESPMRPRGRPWRPYSHALELFARLVPETKRRSRPNRCSRRVEEGGTCSGWAPVPRGTLFWANFRPATIARGILDASLLARIVTMSFTGRTG